MKERTNSPQSTNKNQQGEIDKQQASTIPKISSLYGKEKDDRQNIEEDESIDLNAEQVYKEGDLSPRKIENLKNKGRKFTKSSLPQSQINIRRKKGSSFTSVQ